MTKGRDKVAESLGDILQMISTRKRSGLLSVERYDAGRFEEGELYFQKGRPVYARCGMLSAQESLPKLLTWRNVYYTFVADVPPPASSVLPTTGPFSRRPHAIRPDLCLRLYGRRRSRPLHLRRHGRRRSRL